LKKLNNKTKPIKLINILKKPTGSVYKLKTEKPNRTRTEKNQKKPSQTGKKPSQIKKTELNRFEPVFVLKNQI
jgi:4-diphosphocytidyl-2C-methyl-D-erythritol kinase